MVSIIEKILVVVVVLLVISYFVNNGQMDFTYVNKAVEIAKNAIESESGQRTIQNFKDAASDAAVKLSEEVKLAVKNAKTSANSEDSEGNDSNGSTGVLLEAHLERVIDGDTLLVTINGDEARVRLIGIDTPESVNPDETKNNDYGQMASDHTKKLLKNIDTVYLEFDEQDTDIYDRLLAYVWLKNEKSTGASDISQNMLNAKILSDGYAKDKVYEPNHKYAGVFSELCQKASNDKTGLWQYEEFCDLWKSSKLIEFNGLAFTNKKLAA